MESRFDEIIDRHHTTCEKYDGIARSGRPEDTIPLWVADMDFRAPDSVREALHHLADHGIFGYSFTGDEYFEAVRNWFASRFGWEPKQEWLVCTPGVVYGFSAAIQALTQEGDAVLIQQPVYPPFAGSLQNTGRRLVNSPLHEENGRYCMESPEEMERRIVENHVKIFLLCSPHNPVGRVWTQEELETVNDICLRHGVVVISDEIHADFTFPGHKHTVFASLSKEAEQNCIVCTAPSKTFNLAGLQTSNLFIPNPKLREKMRNFMGRLHYDQPNLAGLTACMAAYRGGASWLDELIPYLAENVSLVRSFLRDHLPQLRLVEPEGTYLLWIDCRGLGLSQEELGKFFSERARLWVNEGEMFGPGGEGFVRVNIGCPRSVLQTALSRLSLHT